VRRQSELAQGQREAETVHRPKPKLMSQRRDTTGDGKRFSAATKAIESAMTASTSRSGRTTTSSTARASVTL